MRNKRWVNVLGRSNWIGQKINYRSFEKTSAIMKHYDETWELIFYLFLFFPPLLFLILCCMNVLALPYVLVLIMHIFLFFLYVEVFSYLVSNSDVFVFIFVFCFMFVNINMNAIIMSITRALRFTTYPLYSLSFLKV